MEELRAQFPVLERVAYLNAGTNGPVPRRAFEATEAALIEQLENGRSSKAWFERMVERIDLLRERAAGLLGASQADIALTGSTTDGINAVLHAVDLAEGDEILTSDEEHPGVLGPLATARDTRGATVRVVPFDELPDEVRPDTRMVVTSHVSWATGRVMDTAPLAASGALVVLDGAQGLGAIPVDVHALGCDFYAASGQKWLCGPGGMGYLYADPELVPDLPAPGPHTGSPYRPGRRATSGPRLRRSRTRARPRPPGSRRGPAPRRAPRARPRPRAAPCPSRARWPRTRAR